MVTVVTWNAGAARRWSAGLAPGLDALGIVVDG